MAKKRFNSLERRLESNPDLRDKYAANMSEMQKKGYIEEVAEAVPPAIKRVWYLPHHPVCSDKKPGKVRIVYDCAAKFGGVSLNDVLLQGPDLTNSLIGVLMRFREENIAVMADIEGMFLQVVVAEEDRDSLQFYWRPVQGQEVKTYRMTRHLFGATSSPACSNKALLSTATDNGHKYGLETVNAIKHNFYVDDCLSSVADYEKAVTLFHDLTNICRDGGFRLTKWMSNNKDVLSTVPLEERAKEVKSLDLSKDDLPMERALGVQWLPENDTFSFNITPAEKTKILLQEVCRKGLEWDEPVDGVLLQRWKQWLQELLKLKEWSVSRCYKSGISPVIISRQLHVFADASDKGYGMAAYLRQEDSDGHVQTSLVMGRSRVASIKYTSIPRLELTAAVMAARLTETVLAELGDISDVYYWTESQTVLKYIQNTSRRFKIFVANRVAVILNLSKPSQWMYVRTSNNPADEASRGQKIEDFLRNTRWKDGPEYLNQS
ncbi:uncharacterized protein LOC117106642, partial [Anneissia japonica]|uniref:uncharacterized protein LOC117106642 n=1 Tax=Anneissia japonica TaxID=1529436 RepID=UPI0014259F10